MWMLNDIDKDVYDNSKYRYVLTNNRSELEKAGFTYNYSLPQSEGETIYIFHNDGDMSKVNINDEIMIVYKNMLFL